MNTFEENEAEKAVPSEPPAPAAIPVMTQAVRNRARQIVRAASGYHAWRRAKGYPASLRVAQIIEAARDLGKWEEIEALIAGQGPVDIVMPPTRPGRADERAAPLPNIVMLADLAEMTGQDKTTVSAKMHKLGFKPLTVGGRRHHAWTRAEVEILLACPRNSRGGFVVGNGAAAPPPPPAPAKPRAARSAAFLTVDRALIEMSTAIELLTETYVAVAVLVAALGNAGKEDGDVAKA